MPNENENSTTERMKLVVEYLSDGNFRLVKDFDFVFSDTFTITIKAETMTDFGSVPKFFQSIISPIGRATKAYVLHDFLLDLYHAYGGNYKISGVQIDSRKVCDKLFYNALIKLGVNKIEAKIIYYAVSLYSLFAK